MLTKPGSLKLKKAKANFFINFINYLLVRQEAMTKLILKQKKPN